MDLHQQVKEFTLRWIDKRHGSAADFLTDIERDLGWAARLIVPTLLESLRTDSTLTNEQHKFLVHTLNEQTIRQAMARESEGGLRASIGLGRIVQSWSEISAFAKIPGSGGVHREVPRLLTF
ncbi:MAG: hypothetical protein ACXWKG_09115 [Limisphaerales bacterium]